MELCLGFCHPHNNEMLVPWLPADSADAGQGELCSWRDFAAVWWQKMIPHTWVSDAWMSVPSGSDP